MQKASCRVVPACLLWFGASLLHAQNQPDIVDYQRQVHPILAAKCIACHGQERRSGGLSLATYRDILDGGRSGASVRPGSSANSVLMRRITGEVEPRMPLGGEPLSPAEVSVIRSWVDQGARPAPNEAAAQPKWEPQLTLTKPPLPEQALPGWSEPMDRFVAAYFKKNGITPPESVSDALFARRVSLDITGMLPSPQNLQAFIADQSPRKREKLVQQLLADDTKYAEHWISFWNDLLRNEEGVVYYSETASRKSITNWLLASLKSNLPFNQFVTSLLNPTAATDPEGFLIGVNWRGAVSASQTPALQAAQNTAQIFLGVNLKCNSCHDSFISKWKLKDAYSLAAYFSSEEKLRLYRCDVAQQQYATAAFLFPELNRPLPSATAEDRRAAAAAIFTDPRNGRMPRTVVNRIWERLMGRGIVENVDEMDVEPWSPELLDWLASDFVANGYDLKRLIATIITSRTYQLPSVSRKEGESVKYVFRGPEIRRLTAEQFADAVASITGDWHIAKASPQASPETNRKPLVISGAPADGSSITPVRVVQPEPPKLKPLPPPEQGVIPAGYYAREWRIAASNLTRALGRPIRDQVYSTRDGQATTIQAIELVNGENLTHWLSHGAKKMLGELPPDPKSLFAKAINGGGKYAAQFPLEIDISHSRKLYLIVQDALSTAPDKAAPVWADMELVGPNGAVPLSSLRPLDASGLRQDAGKFVLDGETEPRKAGVRVKLTSVLVFDIAGKGFQRLRGTAGLEDIPLAQGETVLSRFFIYDQQPDMDRLAPPRPETPLPTAAPLKTAQEAVDRMFWYALGRAPSPEERSLGESALADPAHSGKPSADGLADLLWAVLMKPEFQLVY